VLGQSGLTDWLARKEVPANVGMVATAAELTTMLSANGVPSDVADHLVDGLAGMWLLNEPAEVLAADLACCHPALSPGEVRASIRANDPNDDHLWRLTVVAYDRPGLLAGTAGTLARRGVSAKAAGMTTWPDRGMALQGVTIEDPQRRHWHAADWDELADEVRHVLYEQRPMSVPWKPEGPVKVMASPVLTGQSLITVEAPDRVGLLWAVASWFGDHGFNVEAAQLEQHGARAADTFLIDGSPDVDNLAAHLAGTRRGWFPWSRGATQRATGRPRI
jgi:predicted amino acid-binding ACT domain protein